jgi:hypothetical protein
MEIKQMMAHLLAEMRTNRAEMKEEMMARLKAMLQNNQEKKKARIGPNEKLEVL